MGPSWVKCEMASGLFLKEFVRKNIIILNKTLKCRLDDKDLGIYIYAFPRLLTLFRELLHANRNSCPSLLRYQPTINTFIR